ncbi:DUF3850 domain-containing protein [Aeromonas sp. 602658]|uniref:DUF3850 domain-containing protein n=1 Tax=unclassified Aeromonas TaxID=257493 RepID=UPI003BA3CA56
MIHELKIKPEYFAAVVSGDKTFEIRNNADRNFKVGDTLLLWEWNGGFTGQTVERAVSYITDFEQKPGYVVLGLANNREQELAEQLADATRQCGVMADLLRQVTKIVPAIGVAIDDLPVVDAFLERIEAVLAGKLPNAWLPIETAPRDGRKALVYRPLAENSGDERIAVKRLTGGQSNNCWDKTVPPGATPCNPTDGACHVTHWMPLPDDPVQQGGEPCALEPRSSSPA